MSTIAQHYSHIHHLGMAGLQEFGALIKRARDAKGMTQTQAGQALGRPHSFLVRLERGETSNPPDPQTFDDLSRLFSLPKRDMLKALGYLDPDEVEPGVAYVVYDGDPRVEMLRVLEGLVPEDVRILTESLALLKGYSQKKAHVAASADQLSGVDRDSNAG